MIHSASQNKKTREGNALPVFPFLIFEKNNNFPDTCINKDTLKVQSTHK